tara:strand:- start:35239 stop:35697 length:459 start_codon:yes stop_codon:yes gene_type:complete
MPLKLDFKSGDKMIINGTVIENVGANAKLLVHNEASILREQDIISGTEKLTPASRVYYALQCAYIFPLQSDQYLTECRDLLDQYIAAAPSAQSIADEILTQMETGTQYRTLKAAQKLIRHESDTVARFEQRMQEIDEATSAAEQEAVAGKAE